MSFDFHSLAATLPDDAKKQLLAGECPDAMRVEGALDLSQPPAPSPLRGGRQSLTNQASPTTLPNALKARRVDVSGCCAIESWPQVLECSEFKAHNTGIESVPDAWKVEFRLDLSSCQQLRELPRGFRTGSLVLNGCTALETLPENLSVYFLDLRGCSSFHSWPQKGEIRMGNLNVSGCARLESLPEWLGALSQLDVSGCSNLRALPDSLRVTSWIEVADSGLTDLPPSLRESPLRFRGVPVSYQEVFEHESLSPLDVLGESNTERRRVLLELLGYERFIQEAKAKTLDSDSDAGGERKLLRVDLQDDEPLVVLAVFCPSTGHQYTLRVPPKTSTCRHAAAWIAGFDNPDDYAPLKET